MSNIAIRVHAFFSMLRNDMRDERGQDLLEYALIGGLVAVVLIAAIGILTPFVTGADGLFNNIGNCIDLSGNSTCDIAVF